MMAINTVPNPSDQSALKSKYPWMFQVIDDVFIKRSSLYLDFSRNIGRILLPGFGSTSRTWNQVQETNKIRIRITVEFTAIIEMKGVSLDGLARKLQELILINFNPIIKKKKNCMLCKIIKCFFRLE